MTVNKHGALRAAAAGALALAKVADSYDLDAASLCQAAVEACAMTLAPVFQAAGFTTTETLDGAVAALQKTFRVSIELHMRGYAAMEREPA